MGFKNFGFEFMATYQLNNKQEKYILKAGKENKLSKICNQISRMHSFGKVAFILGILRFLLPLRLLNQLGVWFISHSRKPQTSGIFKLESQAWCQQRQRERRWHWHLHWPRMKIASFKEQNVEDGWDLENSRIGGGRRGKKPYPFASKLPQKCGQAKNTPGWHRQPISLWVFCTACFLGLFQRSLRIYNVLQRHALQCYLEYLCSTKTRDAWPWRQVRAVYWDVHRAAARGWSQRGLGHVPLGSEHLRRAPGRSCPNSHNKSRSNSDAAVSVAACWCRAPQLRTTLPLGTPATDTSKKRAEGGPGPLVSLLSASEPLGSSVALGPLPPRRSMPSWNSSGAIQSVPFSRSPGESSECKDSVQPWASTLVRLILGQWRQPDAAVSHICGMWTWEPSGLLGTSASAKPVVPLVTRINHEGHEDTHFNQHCLLTWPQAFSAFLITDVTCRCPVFLNCIVLCDWTTHLLLTSVESLQAGPRGT